MDKTQEAAPVRYQQGCCADKSCTDSTCMDLPKGLTCGDCVHERRCCTIFGHTPTDTYCDWFPRRFHAKATGVAAPTAPSLALTAFIQDVEAARGAPTAEDEEEPAQCGECAGTGRVDERAKVDNSGRTQLISICCDACEGTGKATGAQA